jgi:hypothetical protein
MPWSAALTLFVGCAFTSAEDVAPEESEPAAWSTTTSSAGPLATSGRPDAEASALIDARIRRRVGGGALDDAAWPAIVIRARDLSRTGYPGPAADPVLADVLTSYRVMRMRIGQFNFLD